MNLSIMKKIFGCLLTAVFVIASGIAAWAGDQPAVTVKMDSKYIAESDVEIQPGEIQVTETNFKIKYDFSLENDLPIALSFEQNEVGIDEDLAVNLPSRLTGTKFGFSTKFPAPFIDSDKWFVGVEVKPSWFTDDGTFTSSAFRVPFSTYGIYKESDKLIWVAGIHVRIDYDQEVLPILGVIYKPDDRWTFNLVPDDPKILYKIDNRMTAFAEMDYNLDEYEVTRGTQEGVVLKHNSLSTGAGLRYAVADYLDASLSAGGVFARKFHYRDDVGKVEPQGGIYGKAALTLKF